ncbi:MAG: NADH-dependent [FeFe] hydrogenase, group A6 [Fusobacteriota bacterium]
MINIKINGEQLQLEKEMTILDAAKKANYKIPTLCYKENLSIYGGCRLCIVEIKGQEQLPISCATNIQEGMEIYTHSKRVREARRNIFELMIANHPFDCKLNCLTCQKSATCELKELAEEIGVSKLQFQTLDKEWDLDDSSLSIEKELSKCVSCGRCIRTCREIQHTGVLTMTNRGPATSVSTFLEKGLGNVDCVNCGQCIIACPTGALHEVYSINQVISELTNPDKHVVVQTAPAVRVALGEEFGLKPGENVEKKMVSALRKMNFDKVFDTNFTADLTIIEEGYEFIDRLNNGGTLPLITSCSPGWVKFGEHNFPDILDNISTCKSPQQMFGALSKSYYADKTGIDPKNIVSVSIMPCTAKKFERGREEQKNDDVQNVDYVLTTRELAKMIKWYGIDFLNLEDSEYDNPFGISTGAGAIFGASGGVMEAALRTAYEVITDKELKDIDLTAVRGLEGIKEAEIDIEGTIVKVAVANGLENAYKLLQHKDDYHFIEIMACPGGCLGGGGQPISKDPKVFEKRKEGLYSIDTKRKYRKSHENPDIKKLYDDFLGEPLGQKSHKYLHTHYKKRKG